MSKPLAGKAELLAACNRRRFTEVVIEGNTYRLRSLSAREYSEIEALAMRAGMAARSGGNNSKQVKSLCDANALLIVMSWVDEEGNPVLSREEISLLGNLDASVSQGFAQAVSEHCGIDAANLDALAKNSGETPSDSSPSD